MSNTPETEALKDKWSGDPAATGYIEELEEKAIDEAWNGISADTRCEMCRDSFSIGFRMGTDFACELECECNDSHSLLEQVTDRLEQAMVKIIKLQSQRDEVQEKYDTLAVENMLEVHKICKQRDEAIKELKEAWLAMDEIEGTDRINEWQNKNANIFIEGSIMNNGPTLEIDALKTKWSGDPTATGYIEELEEKCRNFEFQCNGTYEFLRQMQELCHEYLNAKIKAERAREEVLIELEEYRSIAENIGAEKAVSEKEKAIRELEEVREYADKLANGFPDGMLPKDVEVLRNANHDLAQELHDAMEALRKIEDIFVDSDDTYEDWKSMGQIARTFLENKI